MGTPQIACCPLQALHQLTECEVVGVVSQPDRHVGRGKTIEPTPVKKLACQLGLSVLQPEKIGNETVLNELNELKADLIVVMAYGQILPPSILNTPKFGAVNVHASLLPRHRGAAPIQWAILNGDVETGACLMKMDAGLDTGDILSAVKTPISTNDTAADLHDRISAIGADILREQLPRYLKGQLSALSQDGSLATYARKISKEDGLVDWRLPASQIHLRLRALMPWPGIFSYLPAKNRRLIKIISAEVVHCSGKPGHVLKVDKTGITIGCGHQSLLLKTLQRHGSKILTASEFLNGFPLQAGDILS